MNVLVTGAYGRCGTAIIDHLHTDDRYRFTYLNRTDRPADHEYGEYDTYVADIQSYEDVRPAFDDIEAVVHLAAYPSTSGSWDDVHGPNVVGMQNVLRASRDAGVDSFVYGSTNHVVGMYERESAPEIYTSDTMVTHRDPIRPDSFYGSTKAFGEHLGRQYVECFDAPTRFYTLRIGSVMAPEYDHPYGLAEREVDRGTIERDSSQYDEYVERLRAIWQSRRDFARQVDCCLQDETVEFDVFYGVSDNEHRWFDIDHAKDVIGYEPQDSADEWETRPALS